MSARVLFFTGAPESSALHWESDVLYDGLLAPIARFAGVPFISSDREILSNSSSDPNYASWRFLDLHRPHIATGHSQVGVWADEYQGNARFYTTSALSVASSRLASQSFEHLSGQQASSELREEESSQFYEESFAVHATIGSSEESNLSLLQTGSSLGAQNLTTLSSNAAFSNLTSEGYSSNNSSERLPPSLGIPPGHPVIDLAAVPNARYIESIRPQTMSVNLIVGIISALPPRAIRTRRGFNVEIVELLVGDDTKSGFGINFWLNGSNTEQGSDDLRRSLEALRPQDIVLLKNIAVSSFRGRVYGQSLRRGLTTLSLLYRNRVDKSDVGGIYRFKDLEVEQQGDPELVKTKRVKDWTLRFVGPGVFYKADAGIAQKARELLPPDTQ